MTLQAAATTPLKVLWLMSGGRGAASTNSRNDTHLAKALPPIFLIAAGSSIRTSAVHSRKEALPMVVQAAGNDYGAERGALLESVVADAGDGDRQVDIGKRRALLEGIVADALHRDGQADGAQRVAVAEDVALNLVDETTDNDAVERGTCWAMVMRSEAQFSKAWSLMRVSHDGKVMSLSDLQSKKASCR